MAVTWLSPLGPMKFSYAYPINKKKGDEIQRFQFQLGTTF
jgi:outer membrane protein insertion porin family